jgi:DNA repair exonuclease SbcCD ATPase subunit
MKKLRENYIGLIDFTKSSFYDAYDRLSSNTFSSQEELKTVYQQAEKDLQSLLKSKGIDINKQERERERAKLEQEIADLENKLDKTSEEEEELDRLKEKLEGLDKKTENNPPNSYLP